MAITSSHNSVLLPIVWSAIHCRRQIRNHRKLCSRFITKQRKAKKGAKKETERKSLPETKKNSVFATNFPFGFCFVHQSNSSLFFPFFFYYQNQKIILLVLILYDSLHSFLQWVCQRNESMYY